MGCGASSTAASAGHTASETEIPKTAAKSTNEVPCGSERPKSLIAFAADNSSTFDASGGVRVTVDDVFAWLRWAPPAVTPCGEALGRSFPGALPASAIIRRTDEVLKSLYPDLTASSVLHGQSLCPDEINHQQDSLATRMAEHWGGVFPMGGIGGAPFVGKTGYDAFSHHVRFAFAFPVIWCPLFLHIVGMLTQPYCLLLLQVPDGGDVFILFGPHIGISESGELGKCLRLGQSVESAACGAVLAAYNSCKCGQVKPYEMDMADMEQSWLKQKVLSCFHDIEASSNKVQTLAQKAYHAVEESMLKIINHDYGEGKLILLGGIQVFPILP